MKFDQIWEVLKSEISPKRGHQNLKLITIHIGQMKFLGLATMKIR